MSDAIFFLVGLAVMLPMCLLIRWRFAAFHVVQGQQIAVVLRRPGGAGLPPWVVWQATGQTYAAGEAYFSFPIGTPWKPEPAIGDVRFRIVVSP